jgi:hypothetical protein
MPTRIDRRRPQQPGRATSRAGRILIVAAVVGFGALHVFAAQMMHAAASPIAQAVVSADGD